MRRFSFVSLLGGCIQTQKRLSLHKEFPLQQQQQALASSPSQAKRVEGNLRSETTEQKSRSDDTRKKMVCVRVQKKYSSEDQRDSSTDMKSERVVRIRVVLTQEELKQVLDYHKKSCEGDEGRSSVEQLLRMMESKKKKRSSSSSKHRGQRNWRPVLESIPEDH